MSMNDSYTFDYQINIIFEFEINHQMSLNEVKLIYSKCEKKPFVFLYGG
jgi:hypothetical protein